MQTNDTIFDRYHPAVALIYCGVLLAFSMAAMHPVYLLATFAGLVAYNAVLRGAKAALSGMLWQAPLVLILALANPLFVSAGSTELFRIGLHAVYLEALCYGLCQGLMLVNVLLAFSIAAHVVSLDKVLCVLGNATPTLALMISMTMRLARNSYAAARPSLTRRKRAPPPHRHEAYAPPRRLAAARASVPTQTTSPDPRSRAARLSQTACASPRSSRVGAWKIRSKPPTPCVQEGGALRRNAPHISAIDSEKRMRSHASSSRC